ncbi:MAG TPA: chemotaxis protein CheA [Nitrospiraceae bacterium]|nr:chemotaxis protein CheA [Nitrospiraceae bacterium]
MRDESEILRQTFKEEASDLLSELETLLLRLENDPEDMDAVSGIFRAFHTIKGSGAMAGFDDLSHFTHQVETVYDLVRNRKIAPDRTLIDLTLSACDLMQEMVASPKSVDRQKKARIDELLSSFRGLTPGAVSSERLTALSKDGERGVLFPSTEGRQLTFRIRFRPNPRIFLTGTNPLHLLNELRGLGECWVIAHTDEIPDLNSLDPEACFTYWDVILTTRKDINAVKDVFIFVEDESELKIDVIDDGSISLEEKDYRKLGEILVEKKDLGAEDLRRVLGHRRPLGEVLVEEGLVPHTSVQAALVEQEHVRQLRERRLSEEVISNLRVSSEKLDRLINLIGELVTAQARLSQAAAERNDPGLVLIAEEVQRLTADLRDNTMNIRLMPIGTTFSKFKRLVRDLSAKLGKEVELITEGGETELDKTVIEKLQDPLLHLIRNSLDHGIEFPEVREASGKPRRGTIRLAAAHSGDKVLIKIEDDGAGLDGESIRMKALEKNVISATDERPGKDLYSLIFLSGFSTSSTITNVSGRGVGLDVVKRAVESLRGSIEISSTKGSGTTMTFSLPLTLAIIEGLLVKVADDFFILPLSSVEECIELTHKDARKNHGRRIANVRGQIVPYIGLRDQFMIGGEKPDIEQIVIVSHDNHRIGFVVDKVMGDHQTVIKNLGKVFKDTEEISGATILGDGTLALIINIPKLVNIAEEEAVSGHSAQRSCGGNGPLWFE